MSYIINNSRGNVVAVVADGTINTTSTSLGLVGRSTTEYGTQENENYVFLLENFARDTAPLNPILGQLWYNSSTDVISAYNNAGVWVALASREYVDDALVNTNLTGVPTAPTAAPGTANSQIATTAFVSTSPQFSGVPTAPTAAAGTATTQIATTAFVTNSPQFTGAPTATTAANSDSGTRIATTAFVQAQKNSPAFTGTPTAPTAGYNDTSTQIATTAWVAGEFVSPQFSGVPVAPTAVPGTANTQIATTEFVSNSIGGTAGTMATQNANAVTITGGTVSGIAPLAVAFGGTGGADAATARSGLALGTMATQNANAVSISGGTITDIQPLAVADGGTGSATSVDARTNLGLGSMATQNATAVSITGGTITGITPIAVDHGGTGANTAVLARQNLGITNLATQPPNGVAITGGSIQNVQLSDLTVPLALGSGGTGATNGVTARNNLGLGTMATQDAAAVNITGGTITGISALPLSAGGTGATTAVDARTNLALGTLSLQNSTAVNITGGSISGISALPILSGGTGATNAADARNNLGLGPGATSTIGTMGTQNSDSVSITGGTISGITPLSVASGGTGSGTASVARTNLGAADSSITIFTSGGLTGGGDLTTNRSLSIASDSNGFGRRYVQGSAPSGASNGDIWYQI